MAKELDKIRPVEQQTREKILLQQTEELAGIGHWELNIQTREIYWSDGVFLMLGYQPGEFMPDFEKAMGVIHPDDRERAMKVFNDCVTNGEDYNIHKRLITSTGGEKHIRSRARLICDELGNPYKLIGIFHDITERIQAENEIVLRERLFRALVENASDAVAILRPDGSAVYASPAVENILGYNIDEVLTMNLEDIIHPDDRQGVFTVMQNAMDKPEIPQPDHIARTRHKDGRYRWIAAKITNMLHVPGIEGIVDNFRDVTEQVEAEQKLKFNERRFRSLVQEGADLTAILDQYGNFLYASPNSERILGYTDSELLGTNGFSYFYPEDVEKVLAEFYRLQNEKRVTSSPYRFRHKDGRYLWFRSVGTNLEDEEVIGGMVINSIEITEIMEAQQKLQKSEARYRGLYESQTNFVIRVDLEGNYSYVNKKFRDTFGWLYMDGDLIGKNYLKSVLEHEHSKVRKVVEECIHTPDKPVKVEIQKPGPDGTVLTTLWDFIGILNLNREPTEIQCIGIDITDRIKAEQALKLSNERFELVVEAGSESIYDLSPSTGLLYLSDGFRRNFGMTIGTSEENNAIMNNMIHPDDKDGYLQSFRNAVFKSDQREWMHTYRLRRSNNTYAFVNDKAIILRDNAGEAYRVVGAVSDITASYLHTKLDENEKMVMEMSMQQGAALNSILKAYLKNLEQLFPGMKASVLQVIDDKLYDLASPSLPEIYLEAIHGTVIGNNVGSCGTAAFTAERVIVTNVYDDVRWVNYTSLAADAGVSACWSQPVLNSAGNVIATLCSYWPEPKTPDEFELQALERSVRLISIILAKFEYLESIEKSNERYFYLNQATNDAIYDWDISRDEFLWGDGFTRIFGHPVNDQTFRLQHWIELMHPADSGKNRNAWDQFLSDSTQSKWIKEFRFKKASGEYVFVEETGHKLIDSQGNAIRMIGVLRDVTESRQIALQNRMKNEISGIFKNTLKLKEALAEMLNFIAKNDDFKVAEIWLAADDLNSIKLVGNNNNTAEANDFYKLSNVTQRLKKGEDLPGIVFKTGKEALWNAVYDHPEFERKQAASATGIGSMLGVPISHNDKPIGVLVLGSDTDADQDLLRAQRYYTLGTFLGAEISRKKQEEEMYLMVQSAPDILAIASPDGYFTSVNPAFCSLLGYTAEELTSKPFLHFVHPDDLPDTSEEFSITSSGSRQSNNFINRYLTKSGSYKWISWTSSDKFGEDGNLFAYGRDITRMQDLQNLLDIASKMARVGAWELDVNQGQLYWSAMTMQIHELDKEKAPDLESAIKFYREDVQDEVKRKVEECIQNKVPFDFEYPIITAKGNERWIRAIGTGEYVGKKCLKIYGSIQDIHRQKITELKLQEAYEEKNSILESIGDAFFALDRAWTVTYWNREAENVLGRKREEVLGKSLWEVYSDATNLKFYTEYHKAMDSGRRVHFEEYYPTTGQWFEVTAYPSTQGLSVYFKDVSIRKTAEEQVRLSNERFEKIAEATNDALWDYDTENDVLFWGKGFNTLFGYDPDEERPNFNLLLSLIHPDDRELIRSRIEKSMADVGISNWYEEYRFRKSDGQYAFVIDRAKLIRNKQGKVTRVVGAMTDISYRKEYEESLKHLNEKLEMHTRELEMTNAELEQFAYIASHDLQEPLRMVSSFMTQLSKKYDHILDDKARQYIHFAVDGAARMRQIILDLLNFSRIGKNSDEAEEVDLNTLVHEVLQFHHKTIEETGAEIACGPLPVLRTHRIPMIQMFQNLISNAIKYRRPDDKPEIEVFAREEKNDWVIGVKDNGIGIAPEYHDRVFVIFQRLHARDEYEGTGVGLAIVKKIVEEMGGSIKVESSIDRGSTFLITIPKERKYNFSAASG